MFSTEAAVSGTEAASKLNLFSTTAAGFGTEAAASRK
jgi:hypothetical protein